MIEQRSAVPACVLISVLIVALLAPPAAAQICKDNATTGCVNPGAACSPVQGGGAGSAGVCTTNNAQTGEKECNCLPPPSLSLTGTWAGNDGAIYYLRQINGELWWAGMSVESPGGLTDLHQGLRFANVFHGQVSGNTVTGDWADVPRGSSLNSGTLNLSATNQQIHRQAATGSFAATSWARTSSATPPPDIFDTFNAVKKNQNEIRDHSLLDNLKPAKSKPVMMFGNITQQEDDPDPMHVGYGATNGRTYHDFICLDNNDSPPDGDIDFAISIDLAKLDAQPGFWRDNWETDHGITPENYANKLKVQKWTKIESIMFGGTTECGDDGAPSFLLPGWQQPGALGVLVNGVPIFGQMDLTDRNSTSARINAILGRPISFGMRVRVTGIPVLDCGHTWTHPCDEDDPSDQNQEIHPLFTVDFLQNFQQPRPFATMTGVWSSNDAGTYYVRQTGNTVWWLALSVDEGRTFANVFQGTLQSGQIHGKWADLPLGQTTTAGSLILNSGGPQNTGWTRQSVHGNFGSTSWEKLYDVNDRSVVIVFESLAVNGPSLPQSAQPVEFTVAAQKLEVEPKKLPSSQGAPAQSASADLQARVPATLSDTAALRLTANFAGYRADWTLKDAGLKPGSYTQVMTAPRQIRPWNAEADRESSATKLVDTAPARPLPQMTLHYRIEEAPPQP